MFSTIDAIESTVRNKLKFSTPTHCQVETFKQYRKKKNILLNARTGSGKTIAYLVPLLEAKGTKVILTPTDQLAAQIRHLAKRLSKEKLFIGTPKTIKDMWTNAPIHHLVLDEADLIFLFQYHDDVNHLLSFVQHCQTTIVSATVPNDILTKVPSSDHEAHLQSFCTNVLTNPFIYQEKEHQSQLQHYEIQVSDRSDMFLHLYFIFKLQLIQGKSLLFASHMDEAYAVKVYLTRMGIPVDILCPTFPINVRTATITHFNHINKGLLLVVDHLNTMEVLSRGIDFQRVAAVFNLDVPTVENYRHRAGRAGRGKREGVCMTFNQSGMDDIKAFYKQHGELVEPFVFEQAQLASLKYRHEDVYRSVTKRWILEAKKLDINAMLLKSKALENKAVEEDGETSKDVMALQDALSRGKMHFQVKASLKNVPKYMALTGPKKEKKRRVQKKATVDPLRF